MSAAEEEIINEEEDVAVADDGAEPKGEPDPEMMAKLMAAMGQGGAGGEGGGGMDMASLQAMLGGMGGGGMGGMGGMGGGMPGGPPMDLQQKARANQEADAAKNDGEKDAEGYKWEQTSKYGESEVTHAACSPHACGAPHL
jgi:hypothetical protein